MRISRNDGEFFGEAPLRLEAVQKRLQSQVERHGSRIERRRQHEGGRERDGDDDQPVAGEPTHCAHNEPELAVAGQGERCEE